MVFVILVMLTFFTSLMVLTFTLAVPGRSIETKNLPAEIHHNVAYGTDPRQKMDVYLPADRNRDSTRLIVVIHGGGWNNGDKSQLTQYITELQKRLPGYAFANIIASH